MTRSELPGETTNHGMGRLTCSCLCFGRAGFGIVITTVLLAWSWTALADDVAVLLDGTRIGQRVTGITADGKVTFESGHAPVDLQGLRRIERSIDVIESDPPAALVYLSGGGVLRASTVKLDQDHCTINWAYGQGLKLPIATVRAVRFGAEADPEKLPAGADQFAKALTGPRGEQDRLFVILEKNVQPLAGVFLAMDDQNVSFEWQKQKRTVPRDKAFGLTLAGTGKPIELTGLCLLSLADGSSLWAKVGKLEIGLLEFQPPRGASIKLPWATVRHVEVRSDRLVFLSDLKPVEVRENAIAFVGPWQRNKSVRGNPLKLRGTSYEKGIGVHAESRLTFGVAGGFDAFAATIGIDDETKGKGDCEFVVYGDGQELYRKRVRGQDQPVAVRVKLTGRKQITLAVERGQDLDFADHADWCDARFIRDGGG